MVKVVRLNKFNIFGCIEKSTLFLMLGPKNCVLSSAVSSSLFMCGRILSRISRLGLDWIIFPALLFLMSVGLELFIHFFWDYLSVLQCLDVLVSLPDPFKYLDIIGKPIYQDFL